MSGPATPHSCLSLVISDSFVLQKKVSILIDRIVVSRFNLYFSVTNNVEHLFIFYLPFFCLLKVSVQILGCLLIAEFL